MPKESLPQKQQSEDYKLVEKALEFIHENELEKPSLSQIAQAVNLNESAIQNLFKRWAGISLNHFLQFITKAYAKQLLSRSKNSLDPAYDSGVSSPERLHDLFIHCETITPGEYKKKGAGLKIMYGFSDSPFGECMIARTPQGICNLKFVRHHTNAQLTDWLKQQWPLAELKINTKEIRHLSGIVFPQDFNPDRTPLYLYIQGTHFQIKVWEALTRIPFGCAVSYGDLAKFIELPRADRAVGTAVGKNPIPFIIPCHRVIRKMGVFGEYGEGRVRKKALLGWEAAKKNISQDKP